MFVLDQPWHALSGDEALATLGSGEHGLDAAEAARRLTAQGPNRLPPPKPRSPWLRFAQQFNNLLILVLLGAGLVTAGLGHWIDTAVILGVVVINALIGFLQEGKAERALEAIRDLLAPQATVVRGGRRETVAADSLVPGGVVVLRSGDRVPADLRLLRCHGLQVQESMLTGEALPSDKQALPVPREAALGDRESMAFSGTLVTHGQAVALVVATGPHSEIGRISTMMAQVPPMTTPLLRQMSVFARWLTLAILGLAAATFAFGVLLRGYSAQDMFLAAVGLAVAAIPEGLPAILTITLAIGVTRMARRNAIIRRLPAVETLGSITAICSDKTGTLTRNELSVQRLVTARGDYDVTGLGYAPEGEIREDGRPLNAAERPDLRRALLAVLRCNDAEVQPKDGVWEVLGAPTDGALLALAAKGGLDPAEERRACPRVDAIPFESEHKFMATLHGGPGGGDGAGGHALLTVKGAPERILELCDRQSGDGDAEPLQAVRWQAAIDAMAGEGQRVLAVAVRDLPAGQSTLGFADVEAGGLELLALFGIADPPRPEAIEAIGHCRRAGIAVRMITGDHVATARAIGAQLGLGGGLKALSGRELDLLDDERLQRVVGEVEIFARTTPEHKLRLVRALQVNGAVVAMTGDGVNDAPALKRADVGVAMGRKGTEAAKEASEMVLADDDFASIAHAVEEGRTVYDNLRKAILFILPTNGGEALTVLAAVLFGQLLPITPLQILWVNMITAVTLALALAFERSEADIMHRPPRRPDEPLLSRFLAWRILFVSLILLLAVFGLFLWQRNLGASLETARTVAVNALVAGEIAYLFNTRFLRAAGWTPACLFGSRPALLAVALVVGFQLLFTYAAPLQLLFRTAAIDTMAWAAVLGAAVGLFLLVELEKALLFRRRPPKPTREPEREDLPPT